MQYFKLVIIILLYNIYSVGKKKERLDKTYVVELTSYCNECHVLNSCDYYAKCMNYYYGDSIIL